MSPKNLRVSSITLARNEEVRIEKCLAALSFCDEQIVIDNGSTDRTAQIAQQRGAKVVPFSGLDFGKAHNLGLKEARGEWLLYVDADEIVTPQLSSEILEVIQKKGQEQKAAYFVKRKNYYLGHLWPYQDRHLRLFRSQALKGWRGQLHETPITTGATGTLHHPLIHHTHRTLEEMVAKTNEWSEIEARYRFTAGHPVVAPWRLFRVMLTAFWDSFIKQGGWRVGVVGWIESLYQSMSIFTTYAKLWEMQQNQQ
ncbi:MAG: glycosyltransferase family 2 protein [Patescibacteria group bacterium]